MATATQTLLGLAGERTRIVAGQGAPLTKAQLNAESTMLNTMKQGLSNCHPH
jgi:hypothetical protein